MPVHTTTELHNTLQNGLKTLSNDQHITFKKYTQVVLPLDGWVFWVKTSSIEGEVEPFVKSISGSLHQMIDQDQREDETIAVTSLIFTTSFEIDVLKEVETTVMWIGEYNGSKFSFNKQSSFYNEAGLFHYVGDAVYPALADALVNDYSDLNLNDVVVSSSLPAWLTLNAIADIYPSFLVPTNIEPPYITVHIDRQQAITGSQKFNAFGDSTQLMSERVKLTLYGLRHNETMDFLKYVQEYTDDNGAFGYCCMPAVQDDKRPQSEINALAVKKTIEYTINYEQSRIRNEAARFIQSVVLNTRIVNMHTQPAIGGGANMAACSMGGCSFIEAV